MKGTAKEGSIDVPALGGSITIGMAPAYAGKPVDVGLRPEHLAIDRAGDGLRVDMTESLGGVSYAYLEAPTGERIVVEERGDERVKEGDTVGLTFETKRVYVFDGETEQRIRT